MPKRNWVRWTLSWTLYGMGDWVSKPMCRYECCAWLYFVYNRLMRCSMWIQGERFGDGPWEFPANIGDE